MGWGKVRLGRKLEQAQCAKGLWAGACLVGCCVKHTHLHRLDVATLDNVDLQRYSGRHVCLLHFTKKPSTMCFLVCRACEKRECADIKN